MKRLPILVVALLIGAAAPARAWCEATCLEPPVSKSAKPHCPSHEPNQDGAAISAADGADCPVIESARPVLAKLDLAAAVTDLAPHARTPKQPCTVAPSHPRTPAPLHLVDTPLRL